MGDILKKFGRYFLLDHLAQGGMAEIYRSRLSSRDGAGRLLVIKKIQAGFGSNSEFLQMFKSEIKVTMGFNHPNIVQLYDFGEEEGQPYIAMEWVDGRNLRQFMTRFSELKQVFPIELATYIIEQAASGLNYAHSFRDKITGEPLNIVHRDISPQNILISYEGNVKVIDFGIAKATVNIESTRAGVIKGKPSYLSPEQISGETLDGRSDIFALGAVFWELLTGKKLFAGENDLAVLKLIESCQTYVKPPSTLNPKIPKELDYIVLKALAKHRDKRFQTADELQRALHKFLYLYAPEFNPSDLSYYAKDLFKNDILTDRKKIQKLNGKVEDLLNQGEASFSSTATPSSSSHPTPGPETDESDTGTLFDERPSRPEPRTPARSVSQNSVSPQPEVRPEPRAEARIDRQTRSSQTYSSQQRTASRPVSKPAHSSSFPLGFFLLAALGGIAYLGPQFGIEIPVLSRLFTGGTHSNSIKDNSVTRAETPTHSPPVERNPGQSTPEESAPSLAVVPGKSILLKLEIFPSGGTGTLTLNSQPYDIRSPSIPVPLDTPLELSIERPGFRPYKKDFYIPSNQVANMNAWRLEVTLDPLQFGFLSIHSIPSADAILLLEGTTWRRKTPIENEKLPVGLYSIRLFNEVLGMEKIVSVRIEEGKSVKIDERLEVRN